MKNVLGNPWYWGGGIAAAVTGVVLARVLAPHAIAGAKLPMTVGGQLLALAGLFLICVGVSRRVNRESPSS